MLTNSLLVFLVSASHAGLHNWTNAAEDAKECIRLDPSFLKGYFRLATAQMELQEYDQALATLRQGLSIDSNHPQLLKLQRTIQQKVNLKDPQQVVPSSPQTNVVLDDATRQELQDLQQQHATSVNEYNMVEANLLKTRREFRMHELTSSELAQVPAETKCYRSIGKMFLRSSKERVTEHLERQMEESKRKDTDLTQKMEYLERRIKSQRQNMEVCCVMIICSCFVSLLALVRPQFSLHHGPFVSLRRSWSHMHHQPIPSTNGTSGWVPFAVPL